MIDYERRETTTLEKLLPDCGKYIAIIIVNLINKL